MVSVTLPLIGEKDHVIGRPSSSGIYTNSTSRFTLVKAGHDWPSVCVNLVISIVTELSSHSNRQSCSKCTLSAQWNVESSDNRKIRWKRTSGMKRHIKLFLTCLNLPLLQLTQPVYLMRPSLSFLFNVFFSQHSYLKDKVFRT